MNRTTTADGCDRKPPTRRPTSVPGMTGCAFRVMFPSVPVRVNSRRGTHYLVDPGRTHPPTRGGPAACLPCRPVARLGVPQACPVIRCHDQRAGGSAGVSRGAVFSRVHRDGAPARLARHDAEIPFPLVGRSVDRDRPHPGFACSVRRGERPPDAVCFDPGRVCLRVQVLRERSGRLETQLARRRDRRANPAGRGSLGGNRQQPRFHGHGRTARQLRPTRAGHRHHQRAVGRRPGCPTHHRVDERPRAADPATGGPAVANPAGHLVARGDRRGPRAHHARQPQVPSWRCSWKPAVITMRARPKN